MFEAKGSEPSTHDTAKVKSICLKPLMLVTIKEGVVIDEVDLL